MKNFLLTVCGFLFLASVLGFGLELSVTQSLALAGALTLISELCIPQSTTGLHFMLIKWGAAVVDGRGKLNGWVFAKNRGGAYARVKVTPVNPQTAKQMTVRARLASLATAWRGLTEAQRDSWREFAQDHPYNDIFGDVRTLTGLQMYEKVNLNLLAAGVATIDDPVLFEGVPGAFVTTMSVDASTGAVSFDFDIFGGAVYTDQTLIVQATRNLSAGKNFFKPEFRQIAALLNPASGPTDVSAAYAAVFGAPVDGQKVALRVYAVDNTTGENSQQSSADTIVVP